jgi:hypothetical protein
VLWDHGTGFPVRGTDDKSPRKRVKHGTNRRQKVAARLPAASDDAIVFNEIR